MKKALIQKSRICEVSINTFLVSPELLWVDVPDDTNSQDTYTNGVVIKYLAPVLTPLQQIRALEQAHEDDTSKLNRQAAIDTALSIACRATAYAGMTRDQVHAAYYISNLDYKILVDLETNCAALRKLIVVV